MKLNIYGDLCPTKSNMELFKSGECSKIFGNVCEMNRNADFNIVNLECALESKKEVIDKYGPSMSAPVECISSLAAAGFNIISVANNHSLDNGINSFVNELAALTSNGLAYVGASTKDNAKDYLVLGEGAEKTAILSISDHEYNTDKYGYGVSVFSDYRTYSCISELKQKVPYVIVIYHSGYENAVYPSPKLMDRCRAMVNFGASVVLCQHSHCIGTYEEFGGSLILYGQGNFLFDLTDRESWHHGLCVSLEISEKGIEHRFEPLAVADGCIVELSDEDRKQLMDEFMTRSHAILEPGFVKGKWEELLRSETWKYNAMLKGGSKFDYVMSKVLSMITPRLRLNKKQMATYLLFMRSDTHREALSDLLEMERRR